jgi:hypothetical protein
MAASNYERCLAITLKWEGGYSNHPDDPGGPTNFGIIQREYDKWRVAHGLPARSVRYIEVGEYRDIYRKEYWDVVGGDQLPAGYDLAVFDAAVNNGTGRARQWQAQYPNDIDKFCDARLAFDQRLGRLWRVFGAGWARRISSIRLAAHAMAEPSTYTPPPPDDTVRWAQGVLCKIGLPCIVDGYDGPKTQGAVVLFQSTHGLKADGQLDPKTIAALKAAITPPPAKAPAFNPFTIFFGTIGKVIHMVTSTVAAATTISPEAKATAQGAVVGTKSIAGTLTSLFGSGIFATAAGIFATLAPTTTLAILSLVAAIGAVVNAIGHGLQAIGVIRASDAATYVIIENLLNEVSQTLGGKKVVSDLDPTPATA